MPLLFVKLKKYEKYLDIKRDEFFMREVKTKLMILPLVKVENHLAKEVWINGEKHVPMSQKRMESNAQVVVQQQAVYYFLHSQLNDSLERIMFSFN